jgi:hypothetical protein
MSAKARKQELAGTVFSISGMRAFDDPENPISLALKWLVEDDLRHMCPGDENIPQRYILALLYFSTNGDDWMKCRRDDMAPCVGKNFLSVYHECEWGGITCDSNERIQKINLGEFQKLERRLSTVLLFWVLTIFSYR